MKLYGVIIVRHIGGILEPLLRQVYLTAGIVEAGEVVEIRSAEQWNRLVLEMEGATGDDLGDYDPSSRLVLVGARHDPIDCARSAVIAVARSDAASGSGSERRRTSTSVRSTSETRTSPCNRAGMVADWMAEPRQGIPMNGLWPKV